MSKRGLRVRTQGMLILLVGLFGGAAYVSSMATGYAGPTAETLPRHVVLGLVTLLAALFCTAWYSLFLGSLYLAWRRSTVAAGHGDVAALLRRAARRAGAAALVSVVGLVVSFGSGFLAFAGSIDASFHHLPSLAAGVLFGGSLAYLWVQFRRVEKALEALAASP